MRINRYLAACGVCSRREADRLIDEGRVMVNGAVPVPGTQVTPDAVVTVDGRPVELQERSVVFAYYKPRGVVCTQQDPHEERTLAAALAGRPELSSAGVPNLRLTYIGRLDKESEGLLLLTNDGMLKRRLERGEAGADKEYLVTVDRPVTDELLTGLAQGVRLNELGLTTRPCRTFAVREDPSAFRIILKEGKNRQIRRMCAVFDCRVLRLVRIRECGVRLGTMQPGDLREITETERKTLPR